MFLLSAVAGLPEMAKNLISAHTKSRTGLISNVAKNTAKANATTSGAATATSTAAQATTDIGSTFLNLLVKELQNQDPTAPLDSTQMVGQMISLNQLDQLIAINTAVTPKTTTTTKTTTPTAGVAAATGDSASTLAAQQALLASTVPSPASTASQLTTDSNLNHAAAAQSSIAPAGALNLTNFNSMFGGK
jgi:flagellar basal-body rod modification protein FlgD